MTRALAEVSELATRPVDVLATEPFAISFPCALRCTRPGGKHQSYAYEQTEDMN